VRTDLFDYDLPEGLIADAPPESRDQGRMCVVLEHELVHALVRDFPQQLAAGDLVVLNETKVRRARLHGRREVALEPGREGGAKVEFLFLERLARAADGSETWSALGKANRPLRLGDRVRCDRLVLEVVSRGAGGLLELRAAGDVDRVLEEQGELPIPPYMRRAADARDHTRYQTVFAAHLGSAAAPTAGLHVTPEMLERMRARGARVERLTLHVGIGTFRPVVADDLDQHTMHSEAFEVSPQLAEAIAETRQRGGRVVAIGTTVVRALEAAADPERPGLVRAQSARTELLIQPGYAFRVVDALLTNFHMPKSTLLALVAAFAGHRRVLAAYRAAVEARYRFLSYGDAMWLPTRLAEQTP